jgi:hypothetical protein
MSDPILAEMHDILKSIMIETTETERVYSEFNKYQTQLTLDERSFYAGELSALLEKYHANGISTADRFFNPAIKTLRVQ